MDTVTVLASGECCAARRDVGAVIESSRGQLMTHRAVEWVPLASAQSQDELLYKTDVKEEKKYCRRLQLSLWDPTCSSSVSASGGCKGTNLYADVGN
jgi:hypothetical protein